MEKEQPQSDRPDSFVLRDEASDLLEKSCRAKIQRKTFSYGCAILICFLLFFFIVSVISMMTVMDIRTRIATTKTNLESLRSSIDMYISKTKESPSGDLHELTTVKFAVGYNKKDAILPEIPVELISTDEYKPASENPPNRKIYNKLGTEGGWFYDANAGRIHINYNQPLDKWWLPYDGQNPSEW